MWVGQMDTAVCLLVLFITVVQLSNAVVSTCIGPLQSPSLVLI